MRRARVLLGDAREALRTLPCGSVHCCVTSPPYYGLRDYGLPPTRWNDGWVGCLGLEPTPQQYVDHVVEVLREVRRALRSDGTLWLNLGDSYAHGGCGARDPERWPKQQRNDHMPTHAKRLAAYKPKDLIGVPWEVAFALRDDGWYLRAPIVWEKPNPMPESVEDRPTMAHEYLFLLSPSEHYYYDHVAVMEPATGRRSGNDFRREHRVSVGGGSEQAWLGSSQRNLRSVWRVPTQPYTGAHFAVFPPRLIEPCILAGTSAFGVCAACAAPWTRVVEKQRLRDGQPLEGSWSSPDEPRRLGPTGVGHWRDTTEVRTVGWRPSCSCHHAVPESIVEQAGAAGGYAVPATVLDPFGGAGTTALVALRHGRDAVLAELNPEYARMATQRVAGDAPLLNSVEVVTIGGEARAQG